MLQYKIKLTGKMMPDGGHIRLVALLDRIEEINVYTVKEAGEYYLYLTCEEVDDLEFYEGVKSHKFKLPDVMHRSNKFMIQQLLEYVDEGLSEISVRKEYNYDDIELNIELTHYYLHLNISNKCLIRDDSN